MSATSPVKRAEHGAKSWSVRVGWILAALDLGLALAFTRGLLAAGSAAALDGGRLNMPDDVVTRDFLAVGSANAASRFNFFGGIVNAKLKHNA